MISITRKLGPPRRLPFLILEDNSIQKRFKAIMLQNSFLFIFWPIKSFLPLSCVIFKSLMELAWHFCAWNQSPIIILPIRKRFLGNFKSHFGVWCYTFELCTFIFFFTYPCIIIHHSSLYSMLNVKRPKICFIYYWKCYFHLTTVFIVLRSCILHSLHYRDFCYYKAALKFSIPQSSASRRLIY